LSSFDIEGESFDAKGDLLISISWRVSGANLAIAAIQTITAERVYSNVGECPDKSGYSSSLRSTESRQSQNWLIEAAQKVLQRRSRGPEG